MGSKKHIFSSTRSILQNLVVVLFLFVSTSFTIDKVNELPIPEGIDNMLFYVQRTINANTIVYALNTDASGKINEEKPIKVFWIKYTQGQKRDPLTYIQNNYAYGVKAKVLDKEKNTFIFEFVSYDKKQFYLLKSSTDNQYHVYCHVNNQLTVLNNILVRIDGGTFWFPNVRQVEVYAKDPSTSSIVTEIIKP